jgi:uncharacterized ferritin-like protein (DUF455 family)
LLTPPTYHEIFSLADSLRERALAVLAMVSPAHKCAATAGLEGTREQLTPEMICQAITEPIGLPGRPEKPAMTAPNQAQHRSMATIAGRAALVHSLAHIELNAVNLALDATWRFPDMPEKYYLDWLSVAKDEARHFSLLEAHLTTMGFHYGDFTAHNGLWDMAESTKHDVLARMALVPRTLEARGLDASPQVRNKLVSAGDMKAADIVSVILNDEVGHVYIGNYWYNWLCEQRRVDPIQTFAELALKHKAPRMLSPLNLAARRAAGFSEEELVLMQSGV